MRLLRSWLFAGTAALLGAVVLVIGSLVDGYAVGVLQNVGVALVLFPVLVFAQRTFERLLAETVQGVRAEVADVEERVEEVRREVAAALDQLGEATRDRLQQARDADEEALRRFHDAPTIANLGLLFERAERLNAVSSRGVRIRVPGTSYRLHFHRNWAVRVPNNVAGIIMAGLQAGMEARRAGFRIFLENEDDTQRWPIMWQAEEPADVFAAKLAEELSRRGDYPGDDRYDAGIMFQQLHDTLAFAIHARNGTARLNRPIGPVLEVFPEGWVITDRGLFLVGKDGEVGGYPVRVIEATKTPPSPEDVPKPLAEAWNIARKLLIRPKPPPTLRSAR